MKLGNGEDVDRKFHSSTHRYLATCRPLSVRRTCVTKKPEKVVVVADWKNYTMRGFIICTVVHPSSACQVHWHLAFDGASSNSGFYSVELCDE
jgi:hypothetical protein